MNLLVVVLLGGLWASILLPGALRARRHSSPVSSVDRFERSMGILAPDRLGSGQPRTGRHVLVLADPAHVALGSSRARTLRRRRLMLARLGGGTLVTGLAALLLGGLFTVLFAACAGVATGYVALLVHLRNGELDTRRTVRRLPVQASSEDERPAVRAAGQSATVRVRRWDS
jgi:hypothetical protein